MTVRIPFSLTVDGCVALPPLSLASALLCLAVYVAIILLQCLIKSYNMICLVIRIQVSDRVLFAIFAARPHLSVAFLNTH